MNQSFQDQLSALRKQIDDRIIDGERMDKQLQDIEVAIRESQRQAILKDQLNQRKES